MKVWENEIGHVTYEFRGRKALPYGSYLINVMARVEKLKARGATNIRVFARGAYHDPETIQIKRNSERKR